MFHNVAVGFDGTDRSEDALALGLRLGAIAGAPVTAVCVYWDIPLAPGTYGGGPDMIPADAERAAADLAARFGSALQVRGISAPAPRRALYMLAQRGEADLIVVGPTGRGRIGRTILGTTAHSLLGGTPACIAVAPRGYRDRDPAISRIGVGYCADREADDALALAAELARATGAELAVISAYDGAPQSGRRDTAQAMLDAGVASVGGVTVAGELRDGEPAEVLLHRATDLDLLVMGSRGYGPARQTLLGSVSHDVVTDAPCPVLVVPRPAAG
jgi:nucleotide-binding universal stress UspA family protein